jgi:aspartate aminotransferase
LAYVDFDGARALAALEADRDLSPKDERFLREYTGKNLEAVDRLVAWLGER